YIHLCGIKTRDQFDTRLLQLGAHGRIDVGVAAGNTMAGGTGKLGKSAHKGSADADNVNVHERIVATGV
ncbi:MAG: hypothetical protein RLZZ281_480, partial [Pseudomonadota bacterium]